MIARRHRLANAAEDLRADGDRLTIFGLAHGGGCDSNAVCPLLNRLPSDLAAHAMIPAKRAARVEAKALAARAAAVSSETEALIARLKLEIEKLRRELYGSRSERKARLLKQIIARDDQDKTAYCLT